MAKKLKIRNDEDKTIYELKLEDNPQNEKIKPGKIIGGIIGVAVVIGLSVAIGYMLHSMMLS